MSTQRWNAALPDGAVRALVVDPYDITRLGLGLVLQRQPWVAHCRLARGSREAADLLRREGADVAVVDVSADAPAAAEPIAALRAVRPTLPVVLTSRCALGATAPARSLPGVAALAPAAAAADVIAAVRAVVLDEPPPAAPPPDPAALTARQRQVLGLLATGASNREIAAALHLGPDSVKKHATALYRRLGVRNRTEAAQRAAELLAS